MKKFLILAILAVSSPFLEAGGSLDTETVLNLLKKNEVLYKYVTGTLEMSEVAVGVRLGRQFEEIGGMRIAPYVVHAKPRGGESYTMELVVECEQKFVSADGSEIAILSGDQDGDPAKVVDVLEEVTSISLRKISVED
ncbi:hypothetical protein [Luteolibacter sp. AS25]|uniref:hypothetical protein n=1 Tax=Luteolibacter sp. AS25 TaxID=3135776 RepID=UPI00398B9AF0